MLFCCLLWQVWCRVFSFFFFQPLFFHFATSSSFFFFFTFLVDLIERSYERHWTSCREMLCWSIVSRIFRFAHTYIYVNTHMYFHVFIHTYKSTSVHISFMCVSPCCCRLPVFDGLLSFVVVVVVLFYFCCTFMLLTVFFFLDFTLLLLLFSSLSWFTRCMYCNHFSWYFFPSFLTRELPLVSFTSPLLLLLSQRDLVIFWGLFLLFPFNLHW